jgi:uroporphyrinogen-III synthase
MFKTKHNLPLRDCTIISLRPQGQHAVTYRAAKLLGADFIFYSSIKLIAFDNHAALKNALMCDHIIVTSPAAVRFAAKSSVFVINENSSWFTIGQGTAAALKKVGVNRITTPEKGSDSEALLALPALQQITHQNIGLITAPGGRGLIASTLIQRGASVHTAYVYQRSPLKISAKKAQRLHHLPASFAILCSSHEVFQSFWLQMDLSLKQKLKQGLWVLSSPRLQNLLQEVGISNSTVAHSAQPEVMLAHLVHVQKQ